MGWELDDSGRAYWAGDDPQPGSNVIPEPIAPQSERIIVDESGPGIANTIPLKVSSDPDLPLAPATSVGLDANLARKIQAKSIALDPKLATKLLQIPRGTQFGPTDEEREYLKTYITSARMKDYVRAVLAAIQNGYTQAEEIGAVTGLSGEQISGALRQLLAKGMIKASA